MVKIRKKIWPEFFNQIRKGKKKFELRLADFKCKPGDILVLEEWDPKTKQYSGRKIEKKIMAVQKLDVAKFYELKDIKKYGIYIIEI